MAYTIEFAPRAARDYRALTREYQHRIAPKIDALAHNPRPHGVEKIADDLYRIRVGDYRILYEIRDRVLLVVVVGLGHRREIYRRR